MPIPKPNSGEQKDDFIERCMSAIGDEYEDNDQAVAICMDAWKKKEKKMSDKNVERRIYPLTDIEIRRVDGELPKLVGYAAVFDSLSEDLGGFREKIAPGTFKKSIRRHDIRALWNHDPNFVLGRRKSKTLKLKEDEHGLKMTVTPPDTQWARDLLTTIERGDVDQMSFGFRTIVDEWEEKKNESIRTLKEVELVDVSPVTYPAYTDTTIALRSLEEWREIQEPEPTKETLEVEQETDEGETSKATALARKRLLDLRLRNMEEQSDVKSE